MSSYATAIISPQLPDSFTKLVRARETWLRPGNADAIALGTLCPSGYRFLHVPRITETFAGGIGFLFKQSLAVNTNVCETFKSFELMDISLKGAKAV